ncbi:MAG: hypothetical protein QM820_52715 [Minicystis sp.]
MIARPPRLPALALLSLTAACGPATTPPPPPSAVEITVAPGEPPPPAPPPPPAAPAQPETEVLAAPSPAGCEIGGRRSISPFEKELPLCLAAEGPCFAHAAIRADATHVTATYFEGDARAAGVHLTLDEDHIVVRGLAKTGAVKLYPRLLFTVGSPTSSGDFIVPIARVLEIETAARGRATVAIPLGAGLPLPGGVVRAERRCDELSLDAGRLSEDDARRFIGGKPARAKGPSDALPTGKDTPLSTAPGLPPVAMIHPEDDAFVEVDILERRGRDARIFWMRDGYAVFGWVPSAALKRSNLGGIFGMLGGVPGGVAGQAPRTFTCRAEVPLFVEIASRRVEVGRLRKDARVMPKQRRSGFVPVELAGGPVELGARRRLAPPRSRLRPGLRPLVIGCPGRCFRARPLPAERSERPPLDNRPPIEDTRNARSVSDAELAR